MYTRAVRFLKFVFINVLVVALAILCINWGVGLYLKSSRKSRADLPNYKDDRDHAHQIFNDYNKVAHNYKSFVGWQTLPFQGKTTTINERGLRSHKTTLQDSDSLEVVRFFGGSTMWGEGSDDQHTIPALYNSLNTNKKVLNHGQLAYNTRQNLDALITSYEMGEKSDIVVFYDGVNDAAFLCASDVEVPGHRLEPMFQSKLYVNKVAFVLKILQQLFFENIIKLSVRNIEVDNASLYNCMNGTKAKDIANFFITNWEISHDIVEKRGGKFFAFLQPAAFVGEPYTDHLSLDPALRENFLKVYEEIQFIIRERQYDWVYDLSDAFDGNDLIYIDFCHVSPNGNEIIAQKISEIIEQKN